MKIHQIPKKVGIYHCVFFFLYQKKNPQMKYSKNVFASFFFAYISVVVSVSHYFGPKLLIQAELLGVRMWRWCQNIRIVADFLTPPVEKYLHPPGTQLGLIQKYYHKKAPIFSHAVPGRCKYFSTGGVKKSATMWIFWHHRHIRTPVARPESQKWFFS